MSLSHDIEQAAAEAAAEERATEHTRRLEGEAVDSPTETCSKIKCHATAHTLGGYSDYLAVMRRSPRWGELTALLEWENAPRLRNCDRDAMLDLCRRCPFLDVIRRGFGDGCAAAAVEWAAVEVVEEMLDACPDAEWGSPDPFWRMESEAA